MKAKVITDSGSGLTLKEANDHNIGFLPLQITVDGELFLDGYNLDPEELYQHMEEGKMPTTSQPPLLMQEDLFESLQKDGVTDLILVNLSTGLSGTNATLQATAKRLGMKVHTLDICTTLFVQKYLALAAAKMLEEGKEPEEIIAVLQDAADHSAGYLIPDDLDHLAAGGRLTPMAAKLGGMLKIKPVLEVSPKTQGKVDVYQKVRTFSKAVKKAVEQIKEDMDPNREYEILITSCRCDQGVEAAVAAVQETLPETVSIHIDPLYAVIAVHTGLGSLGIQYVPKIDGVEL